jgi:hypothetical protein
MAATRMVFEGRRRAGDNGIFNSDFWLEGRQHGFVKEGAGKGEVVKLKLRWKLAISPFVFARVGKGVNS